MVRNFVAGTFAVLCLSFVSAVGPVLAMEKIGEISGQLGGEEKSWPTLYLAGAGATATVAEIIPGFKSVHVQGHEGGEFGITKSLSIDFELMTNGSVQEPKVIYIPGDGSISEYYEATPDALQFKVDTVMLDGDEKSITGQVSGTMTRIRREGLSFNEDPADRIDFKLAFDSKLIAEE